MKAPTIWAISLQLLLLYNEVVTISRFKLLQHARFQFEFDSSALEPQVRKSKCQEAAKLQ